MNQNKPVPSLYEDWTARQAELRDQERQGNLQAKILTPVFDFLIREYRDRDFTKQPARFPRLAPLDVNERAIIIHKYLGRGLASGVKTKAAAEDRVRHNLGRLVHDQLKSTEEKLPTDRIEGVEEDHSDKRADHQSAWLVRNNIRQWRGIIDSVEISRLLQINRVLPSALLRDVFQRIDQCKQPTADIVDLFYLVSQCKNSSLYNHMVRSWQQRIVLHQHDELTAAMTACFLLPANREGKLMSLRPALAHENSEVRFSTVAMLSHIGTFDDIGILSDLLLLPQSPDEHPNERNGLAEAIRRIAHRRE